MDGNLLAAVLIFSALSSVWAIITTIRGHAASRRHLREALEQHEQVRKLFGEVKGDHHHH